MITDIVYSRELLAEASPSVAGQRRPLDPCRARARLGPHAAEPRARRLHDRREGRRPRPAAPGPRSAAGAHRAHAGRSRATPRPPPPWSPESTPENFAQAVVNMTGIRRLLAAMEADPSRLRAALLDLAPRRGDLRRRDRANLACLDPRHPRAASSASSAPRPATSISAEKGERTQLEALALFERLDDATGYVVRTLNSLGEALLKAAPLDPTPATLERARDYLVAGRRPRAPGMPSTSPPCGTRRNLLAVRLALAARHGRDCRCRCHRGRDRGHARPLAPAPGSLGDDRPRASAADAGALAARLSGDPQVAAPRRPARGPRRNDASCRDPPPSPAGWVSARPSRASGASTLLSPPGTPRNSSSGTACSRSRAPARAASSSIWPPPAPHDRASGGGQRFRARRRARPRAHRPQPGGRRCAGACGPRTQPRHPPRACRPSRRPIRRPASASRAFATSCAPPAPAVRPSIAPTLAEAREGPRAAAEASRRRQRAWDHRGSEPRRRFAPPSLRPASPRLPRRVRPSWRPPCRPADASWYSR